MTTLKWAIAGFVLGLILILAPACGGAKCGPATCSGCCTAQGRCDDGTQTNACGLNGGACATCSGADQCSGGFCTPITGQNTCSANTCANGCCQNNQCITSQSATACGSGGASCQSCPSGDSCVSGQCTTPGGTCDASTCPNGCCQNNTCQTGNTLGACGTGGTACAACASNQTCTSGQCAGGTGCTPSSCPAGCCQNNACQPGNTQQACGTSGAACSACPTGTSCTNGTCQPTGTDCFVPSSFGTVTAIQATALGDAASELYYYADLNADPDLLRIELFAGFGVVPSQIQPGTYNLANDTKNYADCGACVIINANNQPGSAPAAYYFAQSGTLQLTQVSGSLAGTLSNAQFIRVNIASSTFQTTPANDGCVTHIASHSFNQPIQ
jgi:hypothetical protein